MESRRADKISVIQYVLDALLTSRKWKGELANDLDFISNPYPGMHLRSGHVDILDDATLEKLYVVAADDCEKSILRWRDDEATIARLRNEGVAVRDIRGDPHRCAAHILNRYELPLPTYARLPQQDAYAEEIPTELYRSMQELLYPDFDELLPFVLLITLMFAFNPGVVLHMTHSDYDDDDTLFGRERIRLKPFKPRANKNQISIVLATDDLDNPRTILRHLESRTAYLRPNLRKEFADRVFIRFSPGNRRISPVQLTDDGVRKSIERFCKKHELDIFQLQQIRPTTLDLVHEVSGGNLLSMTQVANHVHAATTLGHYARTAFHRRNEEMLANGMQQLDRKYLSDGRIDVASRHRLRSDLGSATPGFACLDPYASPFDKPRPQDGGTSGPRARGRLCQAYGKCPMCPLAMIDPTSPETYAYLYKLREAIEEARGRLGAPWISRWQIVSEKLTLWARLFRDKDVIRKGVELATFTIPDLPKLD
ncbi:hypothetical protein A7E77_07085 [Sphingomonas sp. NIC1]|nr:hypothetical protein A7E77_07085 [Sphingomonas sp. NIC1]